MKPTYQKIFEEYLLNQKDAKQSNILDFIQLLDTTTLQDCMEDILTNQSGHLARIFHGDQDRFSTSEEQLFAALMRAPKDLIRTKISPALDILFFSAINGKFAPEINSLVIDRIYAITAKNKVGLSSGAILEITEFRQDIKESLRIELLMLLSKLDDSGDYSFWDTIRKTIPTYPQRGSAVIEAFKKQYPWRAFEVVLDYNQEDLRDYIPEPDHEIYFESSLEMALYNCLKEPGEREIERFWSIRQKVDSSWFAQVVDNILSSSPFSSIWGIIKSGNPASVFSNTQINYKEQQIKTTNIPVSKSESELTNTYLLTAQKLEQSRGTKFSDLEILMENLNQKANNN